MRQAGRCRDHALKWNAPVMWGRVDLKSGCDHSKDLPRLEASRQQPLKVTVAWHYRTLIYVHNMRWNTCSETAAWQLVMDLSYLYKTGSWAPTGGSRGFCLLSACSDIPSFGQGLIRTTELPNRTLHQVYLVIAVRAFGLMW